MTQPLARPLSRRFCRLLRRTQSVVILLIALLPAMRAHAEDTVLRVGYLRTQGYIADFPLAGVKIPGVKLEIVPLETGNDVLEAVSAHAVDVGETGEVQPIFAQSGKRPIKVIASTGPQPAATAILVLEQSPVKQVEDLRGKRVSFVRGTNTHWLVIQSLARAGLRQSDIRPALLGPADTLSALKLGHIDAATLTAPNIEIAQHQGARVLVDGHGLVNSSIYYLATTDTIASKREAIGRFVAALSDHLRWIQAHKNERATWLAPKYGIPPELVLDASGVMAPTLAPVGDDALVSYTQQVADAFADQKLIPARIDVREEFDGSFDKDIRR
ncbi:ABC transporter substrate-binding protein [Paraburkholderia xenovorans]|uniref:ABC transporter substrate-binding protein n=1 Tax=Paraburkholderia xenovorans TaxID=36873 RepID=UPI001558A9D1|nr:ABC transporter substrate-binding protein [Paraburkholderia xenovorans]NPT39128.1 transporter substrate-binding domain-containing protein [Paraburkholderia xenovorans]